MTHSASPRTRLPPRWVAVMPAAGGVVDGVGDVSVVDASQGLGPIQRGAFAVGVVGGLAGDERLCALDRSPAHEPLGDELHACAIVMSVQDAHVRRLGSQEDAGGSRAHLLRTRYEGP